MKYRTVLYSTDYYCAVQDIIVSAQMAQPLPIPRIPSARLHKSRRKGKLEKLFIFSDIMFGISEGRKEPLRKKARILI